MQDILPRHDIVRPSTISIIVRSRDISWSCPRPRQNSDRTHFPVKCYVRLHSIFAVGCSQLARDMCLVTFHGVALAGPGTSPRRPGLAQGWRWDDPACSG